MLGMECSIMKSSDGGKGSSRRPYQITKEEEDLRWKLAFGKITVQEFNEGMEKLEEKRMDIIGSNGPTGEHYESL